MHYKSPLLTFKEWVKWLETRHLMPLIAPGLERTLHALERAQLLGKNSEEHTIHIAGTNGKGTTAKALEFLIASTGDSVGLFTSPHLVTTCERISVNGTLITEEEFVHLCEKHKDTILKCELTHFEALTLIAFDYFLTIKKTKWMIFEIGLGGLWDSTNAIPHKTSVITTIGLDHTHILGNTLEEIAHNKFGIIKDNNRVIHQTYPPGVTKLLEEKLNSTNSSAQTVHPLEYKIQKAIVPKYSMIYKNQEIPLNLPGKRAIENMSTAITTFTSLGFSDVHVQKLSQLQWPARMTPLNVSGAVCPVYLSGDHNEQGIESLCELLSNSTYERLFVVLGLSKGRSHSVFVSKLQSLRDCSVIFTAPRFQGVVPDLLKFFPYYAEPAGALSFGLSQANPKDLLVVSGSLYLCGDLLSLYPL